MKKNNILLIGFMGVGKGTIARQLSVATGMYAVDTDDLIESLANKSIKKIFKKHGESYFRQLETRCALWCQNSLKETIISTGGGFYMQPNISDIGDVVYLKADFDYIFDMLKSDKNHKKKLAKRPLFADEKKALKLYNDRALAYEMVADMVVDVRHKTDGKIVKEITKAYR